MTLLTMKVYNPVIALASFPDDQLKTDALIVSPITYYVNRQDGKFLIIIDLPIHPAV